MPVLKKPRWLLLKREENLKTEQRFRLCDLLRYNLKTIRVMRSRIEPMKNIARSLRQHRELILNYFRAQKLLSSGVVEGLNNKLKSP